MDVSGILFLIIGIVIGSILGWFIKKNNSNVAVAGGNTNQLKEEIAVMKERIAAAVNNYKEQKDNIENLLQEKEQLISNNSRLKEANENLGEKLKEHKQEVEQLQQKFSIEFENIANKLLKQNSSELVENHQKRLNEILNPLKENIKTFEKKVDENYEKELKDRTSLIEQIKSLEKLNTKMSEDAYNLTKALKGDNKAQGNWGELILEKILESSGLAEGLEYEAQYSTTNDDGARIQPDILIKLPDKKHIIIDAKVSLIAYQSYINSENEEEQIKHLKNHLSSVKTHIKGLSEKHYISGKGIDSPDFVLLFMPIESSFGLAIKTDNELYQYAWNKKVVIVTPSTLLATLKTIASLWKQAKQTKNAIEIARQAGALHDKFVGFIEDMEKIKKSLEQSNTAYDKAFNKLKSGNGNLIDATIRLEKLGAKTKKQLPNDFLTNDIEHFEK